MCLRWALLRFALCVFFKAPKLKKNPYPFSRGWLFSPTPGRNISLVLPRLCPSCEQPIWNPAPPHFMGCASGKREGSTVREHSSWLGFLEISAAKSSNWNFSFIKKHIFILPVKLLKEIEKSGRDLNLHFCRCSSGKVQKGPDCSELGNSSRPPGEHLIGCYW